MMGVAWYIYTESGPCFSHFNSWLLGAEAKSTVPYCASLARMTAKGTKTLCRLLEVPKELSIKFQKGCFAPSQNFTSIIVCRQANRLFSSVTYGSKHCCAYNFSKVEFECLLRYITPRSSSDSYCRTLSHAVLPTERSYSNCRENILAYNKFLKAPMAVVLTFRD